MNRSAIRKLAEQAKAHPNTPREEALANIVLAAVEREELAELTFPNLVCRLADLMREDHGTRGLASAVLGKIEYYARRRWPRASVQDTAPIDLSTIDGVCREIMRLRAGRIPTSVRQYHNILKRYSTDKVF